MRWSYLSRESFGYLYFLRVDKTGTYLDTTNFAFCKIYRSIAQAKRVNKDYFGGIYTVKTLDGKKR